MPHKDPEAARAYRAARYQRKRKELIAQISNARRRRKARALLDKRAAHKRLSLLSPVAGAIEQLLDSRRFDPELIPWLADRGRYAEAVTALTREIRRTFPPQGSIYNPITVLVDRRAASIAPYRLALAFNVIEDGEQASADVLRELARGKGDQARRAKVALACLGFVNWYRAERATRAAFALGRVVRERIK